METKTLLGGQVIVEKYYMLPTPKDGQPKQWIYKAYYKTDSYMGAFSVLTTFDGQLYGQIGSDPDKSDFDHLPVGSERFNAVEIAYKKRALIAEGFIHNAFQETLGHIADNYGEIEIYS